MDKCKAAYLPHEMAFPRRYVINKTALSPAGAEAVKAACKYDAVDLEMKPETVKVTGGIYCLGDRLDTVRSRQNGQSEIQ